MLHPKPVSSGVIALAVVLLGSQRSAQALDKFEIQVYQAEVNRPWQPGLEVHSNYTISGQTLPSYAGETPPDRLGRLTLEPALGITNWFELGAYVQGMVGPDGSVEFGGAKLRGKFVLPRRPGQSAFAGLNVEVGRVPRAVEEDGWANEFRPILGYQAGRFLFDINPIFGYALSGPDAFRLHVEPCGKVAFDTRYGFALGAEYYAGLGLLDAGLSGWRDQEHLVFATFDLVSDEGSDGESEQESNESSEGEWELNVGIGHGLTDATAQRWVAKMILGKSF